MKDSKFSGVTISSMGIKDLSIKSDMMEKKALRSVDTSIFTLFSLPPLRPSPSLPGGEISDKALAVVLLYIKNKQQMKKWKWLPATSTYFYDVHFFRQREIAISK